MTDDSMAPGFHPFQRRRRIRAGILLFLVVAACAALFAVAISANREQARAELDPALLAPPVGAPPVPTEYAATTLMPMEASAAQQINGEIPFASAPNPAADPFVLKGGNLDRLRATDCLTAAIYYEAASEAPEGQRAVAQVVLNRVRHPAFPSSICGVVFQGSERQTGCQFTFTCDGSLLRTPSVEGWARARRVALSALGGYIYAPVGWATHYHADYVVPVWARQLDKIAQTGVHIFYNWRGGWGRPGAFRQRYAAREDMDFYSAQAGVRLAAAQETQALAQEVPQQLAVAPVIRGSIRDVRTEGLPTGAVPLVAARRWGIRQEGTEAPSAPAAGPGAGGPGAMAPETPAGAAAPGGAAVSQK